MKRDLPLRMTGVRIVLSIALLGCNASPHESFDIPDAPPRDVSTRSVTLQPGQSVDGVLTGDRAGSTKIHLTAPLAELDWNIEDGTGAKLVEYLDQMNVDYPFVPPVAGSWYLHVTNGATAAMLVDVRVELYGNLSLAWQ